MEGSMGWHGKALVAESDLTVNGLTSFVKNAEIVLPPNLPAGDEPEYTNTPIVVEVKNPDRKSISTRKAYGLALVKAY